MCIHGLRLKPGRQRPQEAAFRFRRCLARRSGDAQFDDLFDVLSERLDQAGFGFIAYCVPPTFQTGLLLLELRLVDLVEGDLVGDGAPRQAGEAGGAADVAAGPLEGPAEVALLEGGGQLGELIGQRPGQVDGELVAGPAGLEDLGAGGSPAGSRRPAR